MLSKSKKHPLLTVTTTRKLLKSYQFCMDLRARFILYKTDLFLTQSHKMVKHTQTIRRQFSDELLECV